VELAQHLGQARLAARHRDDPAALAREGQRDRAPDPAASARDQAQLARELEVHGISQVEPHSAPPPSWRSVVPVMNCAAGDARKTIAAAVSSTVPARLSGICEIARWSSSSGYCAVPDDRMMPGATALTRIPNCAHSIASDIVRFSTPARAAPVCAIPGKPR